MQVNIWKRSALHYRRALITWAGAYVTITALGIGGFFLIAAIQHTGSYAHPLDDPSYLLEEKFLPLANLVVWTLFALAYFGKRRGAPCPWFKEPVQLGALWLAIALPADLVSAVLIRSAESMTAHDFYIGQFPWIYLIYVAVFISPICAASVRQWLRRLPSAPVPGGPRPARHLGS